MPRRRAIPKPKNPSPKRIGEGAGGELELLQTIRKRAGQPISRVIQLGIGDDCALLRPPAGEELAVTTDLSIEGRHFRLDWHAPESVGHRALARGLSDLAAMGARPVAAFLSLALPRNLTFALDGDRSWVDRFLDGLLRLAEEHGVTLAGGDLAESPLAIADVVLTGTLPKGQALLRSGARPGDRIYVTGSLGGAAAELDRLSRSPEEYLQLMEPASGNPHLYPQPRVAQGLWLRKHGRISAAIDLSDGISTDLAHLAEASGVGAVLDAAALPLGPGATLAMALNGGEDYELLFTAPAAVRVPRRIGRVPITAIGRMVPRTSGRAVVSLLTSDGEQPLERRGWEHFSG